MRAKQRRMEWTRRGVEGREEKGRREEEVERGTGKKDRNREETGREEKAEEGWKDKRRERWEQGDREEMGKETEAKWEPRGREMTEEITEGEEAEE